MKFIPRVSGRKMATVRPAHHLGGAEIAALLCRFASEARPQYVDLSLDPTSGSDMTTDDVKTLVREAVWSAGAAVYFDLDAAFDEDDSPDYARVVSQWAAGQVRRLYPELDDTRLTEFEDLHRATR